VAKQEFQFIGRRFKFRWPIMFLIALETLAILFSPVGVFARPFRGSVLMSVILCKSSDSPAPSHDLRYFEDLVFNPGAGGLADYWRDVSYQNVNLNGSTVRGWYTVSKTTAEWQAIGDRWAKVALCEDAAKNDPSNPYVIPSNHKKIFVTSPSIDFFGWNGGAFVDTNVNVGGLAHEGGHGIGLNHSFSMDPEALNVWWAQRGEYDDPWDAMSWANAFAVPTRFGSGPPWMIGYNLDRMGWLPRSRIVTFGSNGTKRASITIAALSHPDSSGALYIRVPFDSDDPMHYYTVEFRKADRWDAGIPRDSVLVHEIKKSWTPHGDYQGHVAYLVRELSIGDKFPVQQLDANDISIKLDSIDAAHGTAQITIFSNFPSRCMPGYVWRESRSYDLTCVPPGSRSDVRNEDNLASTRVNPNGGPFGQDTCKQGFVWREAITPNAALGDPADHVCVSPASRLRERQNNQLAANRTNPARITYGPNTCKSGFVWREADDFDWVCVAPSIRQQVRDDNAQAASRREPNGGAYGPDTCKSGFVWRDAFPNDHICVLPPVRSQAASDNANAQSRLVEN
jgi:hypothetical protein